MDRRKICENYFKNLLIFDILALFAVLMNPYFILQMNEILRFLL
jgi:hypothetical protein